MPKRMSISIRFLFRFDAHPVILFWGIVVVVAVAVAVVVAVAAVAVAVVAAVLGTVMNGLAELSQGSHPRMKFAKGKVHRTQRTTVDQIR